MNARTLSASLAAAALAAGPVGFALAAPTVSYTGGTVTQNFDGLPSTGSAAPAGRGPHALNAAFGLGEPSTLDGWYGGNPGGTSTATEFRAQDGSLSGSGGRGVVSFGNTADRALGSLATSNQVNHFGVVLTNDSANTYTSFTLSYTGEQWREGNLANAATENDRLVFSYGPAAGIDGALAAAASLDFVAVENDAADGDADRATDGNTAAFRAAVSDTVSGLNWAPGTTLVLRWAGTDFSGQDHGLAVDDLSFTAAVPEPAAAGLSAAATAALATRRRSRRFAMNPT